MKKKYLVKAMAFAMALSAISPMAVKAEETSTTGSATATVSYEYYNVEIDAKNEKALYVYVEVLKDKAGSKVSATYAYPAKSGKATVDLSFLKATKEQYIRVYSDVDTKPSAVITIAAQPEKLKVKFLAGQDDLYKSFSIYSGKTEVKLENDESLSPYYYRTPYSYYVDDLKDWDKDSAVVAGTTLIIHKGAENGKAPASAEVKVKVAAIAKAPKVAVDYVKGVFNLKKGTDVRILYNGTEQAKWTALTDAKKVTIAELFKLCNFEDANNEALKAGFTLEVRTSAVAGKKAASAIAFVKVDGQLQVAKTDGKDQVAVKVGETNYTLDYKGTDNGIEFTATGASYEYFDANKDKWITVKPGKAVVYKVERKAGDEALKIKVRLAGVKANAKTNTKAAFASNEVEITVAAPTATPTPTPTTAPTATTTPSA